jgi:hypothetical protein
MEVELIEPELFLGMGNASDRFAEKIAGVLDGHEPSSKPSRSHLASAK